MFKFILALSVTVFTLSVFCFPSDAYYVRSCSGSNKTVPISQHKEIAEDTSATSDERISAIRCLSEYGAEGARILCGLLERDFGNNDVMIYSLNSIGEIRDRSVIIALHDFIKRIDIELDIARRIDEVQDTPAYQADFDALAGEEELSIASVISLTNALGDTTDTYRAVYDALAGEIEGVLSSESVSSLKKALRDTSDDVRWRAVVLLGHSRHPDAIPAIYKRLRNDPSLQVRLQAAESLGRLAGEKAVPALDEALANDPAMLHGVISGLGHAGGAGVPVLIEMLNNEINNPNGKSQVANLIVHSLKNTGDRRAIQPLIELITRPADSNQNWESTQKWQRRFWCDLRFIFTTTEPFTIVAALRKESLSPR